MAVADGWVYRLEGGRANTRPRVFWHGGHRDGQCFSGAGLRRFRTHGEAIIHAKEHRHHAHTELEKPSFMCSNNMGHALLEGNKGEYPIHGTGVWGRGVREGWVGGSGSSVFISINKGTYHS